LDWAKSVTALAPLNSDAVDTAPQRLRDVGVRVIDGTPAALVGDRGRLAAVRLTTGEEVPCDVAFVASGHRQRSELPAQLGCALSGEGCVVVDEHGATSVANVFAAGDMTAGPHLVQVAAAKGVVAGIGAAMSLRGERGAPNSPLPAPDPERSVH
jgi:thioredoxin reductase (NADPH)